MKPKLSLTTVEQVRTALDYDPARGVLTWRDGRKRPGAIAGSISKNGYLVVNMDHELFFAHRLAWLHFTGEWPSLFLDHINRNKLDNRICNLREANWSQNAANRSPSRKVGLKGAYLRASGNWQAVINTNGKARSLGTFPTEEEASLAYFNAARAAHGDFATSS